MQTNSMPINTSLAELIQQIYMDANATEREKFLAELAEKVLEDVEDAWHW